MIEPDPVLVETDWRQEAQVELSAALNLFCSMEMTFWLPRAEAELARTTAPAATSSAG